VHPEEGNKAGERARRKALGGAAIWVCLVWRKEGMIPSWGEEVEGDADLFSLDPVIGCMGMVQSCARGGSHWTLGSISLITGWWSNSGTGFLERRLMPQDCQCLRGIWTMSLITAFNFRAETIVYSYLLYLFCSRCHQIQEKNLLLVRELSSLLIWW